MIAQARVRRLIVVFLTAAVPMLAAASMLTGAGRIPPEEVLGYLFGDVADEHLATVVHTLRLPRTLAGLLVGCALGVSGSLLQTVTRNPLADTGLLGVNAGAALGVVVGVVAGAQTAGAYLVWALAGAVPAAAIVLLLGARFSPLKLVLAGAAVSAAFSGVTSALLVAAPSAFDQYRFWILGSLAGVPLDRVLAIAPAILAGLVIALLSSRALATLSLGDDVAVALGNRPGHTRVVVTATVTLLCAAAVAVAGPIGFVGLLAGYLARTVSASRVIPQIVVSGLAGTTAVLTADVLARVVMRPYEAPVSLLVALIGGPVLIAVARSRAVTAGIGRPDARASGGRARRLGVIATGRVRRLADRVSTWSASRMSGRIGGYSVLFTPRPFLAFTAFAAVAAMAGTTAIVAGQSGMSAGQAISALFGDGQTAQIMLVREIRLPRIMAGLLAGAVLGLSGCLTQTLSRNRLATPDLLGINQGAVIAIIVAGLLSPTAVLFEHWWAGPLGALAAALVVLAVSGGTGRQGYRFIVTGLAVSTIAGALTQTALAWQGLGSATAIYSWTVGSLSGRGYPVALPVAVGLAVLLPVTLAMARRLDLLRFGEEVAAGLGVSPSTTQRGVLAVAVVLAGLATGIAGPIAFVALAAPVLASWLAGPSRVPLFGSAAAGAALVVLADTLGRIVVDGIEIPVGVVTSVLGGPFLLWTLITDRRS